MSPVEVVLFGRENDGAVRMTSSDGQKSALYVHAVILAELYDDTGLDGQSGARADRQAADEIGDVVDACEVPFCHCCVAGEGLIDDSERAVGRSADGIDAGRREVRREGHLDRRKVMVVECAIADCRARNAVQPYTPTIV